MCICVGGSLCVCACTQLAGEVQELKMSGSRLCVKGLRIEGLGFCMFLLSGLSLKADLHRKQGVEGGPKHLYRKALGNSAAAMGIVIVIANESSKSSN